MAIDLTKYYLVALPEKELLYTAMDLQQIIADKFNIYQKPFPKLHITLGVLHIPDQDALEIAKETLQQIAQTLLPIEVQVVGSSCFSPPHKSVNLALETNDQLQSIAENIITELGKKGIECNDMKDWDYHISLVNTHYALKEWQESEYQDACDYLKKRKFNLSCLIKRIELWDPDFPPLKVVCAHELDE